MSVVLFAERFYKFLVTVGFFATQMEITVNGLNTVVQLLQDEQQGHAVGTSAQCHKMKTFWGKQSLLRDEIGNFIFHFSLLTFHST